MVANEQAPGSETTGADYAGGAADRPASESTGGHPSQPSSAESTETSIKEDTWRVVEEQKSAAADRIGGIAHAADRAAGEFERQIPQAADALHSFAQRLDSAASAIRERSLDDWISEARDFARRQPVTFFAGAVAAGFAVSRFLKSASPRTPGHR